MREDLGYGVKVKSAGARDGDGWQEVGRGGRLRAPRDAGGGGGEDGSGGGQGVGQGQRRGGTQGQAAPYRARPRAPDIRAKVKPKPNTVMLNCSKFQELPTEAQVADWFGDHLFTGEIGSLLAKVGGVDIEEREKRILVQLTSSEEVDQLLTRMGEEGVEWPDFVDPISNQPIRIRGFSTDKSSLRVTLLDVPRDIEEDTIKEVMSAYGTVQEVKRHHLNKAGMEHIVVNRVSVKLARDQEVDLPTTIFGLGSATNGEDRSIWRVTYPGAPRRCFRCGNPNHMARDCKRPPITMQQVEMMPSVGEALVEGEELENRAFPKSFAAVVKSAKYLDDAAAEKREAERKKVVRQERKEAEDKKKENERKKREDARLAKMEEKKQEDQAKQAAHLAELGKSVEKAALHKKYIKNLYDQARAEVRETEEYEKDMENMMKRSGEEDHRLEKEGGKRPATSPAGQAPWSKKPPTDPLDGGT